MQITTHDSQLRNAVSQILGTQNLTPEKQTEVMNEVGDALMDRAVAVLMSTLKPEDLEHAAALAEGEKMEAFFSFIEQKVPNYDSVIENAVLSGLDDYQKAILAHTK